MHGDVESNKLKRYQAGKDQLNLNDKTPKTGKCRSKEKTCVLKYMHEKYRALKGKGERGVLKNEM